MERDRFRCPRRERDLAKRLQLPHRPGDARGAVMNIELDDLLGGPAAGVGDPRADRDLAVGGELVSKEETERRTRNMAPPPSIANVAIFPAVKGALFCFYRFAHLFIPPVHLVVAHQYNIAVATKILGFTIKNFRTLELNLKPHSPFSCINT